MSRQEARQGVPITVVGSGYVGTVAAAAFSSIGHSVIGLEVDAEKLASLRRGEILFHEPGLAGLVAEQVSRGNLSFTDSYEESIAHGDAIFLCVGTPSSDDGRADMRYVENAAHRIGEVMSGDKILVTKSTVPIGSGRWLETLVEERLDHSASVSVVSNPEFLREGSAVEDFLYPDRIVIGSNDRHALDLIEEIYGPILDQSFTGGRPDARPALVRTDLTTAETVKYAANAFLASKISFINEIAGIADAVGANIGEVSTAIGLDTRIGSRFLNAGIGWGGSCFGKDLAALAATAREHSVEPRILDAVMAVNQGQIEYVVAKLQTHLGALRGRRIALLGLSFKPETDDMRDAPALKIASRLLKLGGVVSAYDPVVHSVDEVSEIRLHDSALAALDRADAVVVVTEWKEFLSLSLDAVSEAMEGSLFVDGRNAFDPSAVAAAGLTYVGIGR